MGGIWCLKIYFGIRLLPFLRIVSILFILSGLFRVMSPTILDRIFAFIIGIPLLIFAIYISKI